VVDVEITRFLVEEPRTVQREKRRALSSRLQHGSFSTTLINIIVHARSKKHDYNSGKLESACPLSVAFLKHIFGKSGTRDIPPQGFAKVSIILIFTKHGARRKNLHVTRIFHLFLHVKRLTNFTVYIQNHFPGRDIAKIRMITRTLPRLTRNKKLIFGSGKKIQRRRARSNRLRDQKSCAQSLGNPI